MGAAGQRGRDPQHPARGIGDDLHVHAVAAVLLREVGPAVADSVALGERPIEQDVFGIGLAQDLQQSCRGQTSPPRADRLRPHGQLPREEPQSAAGQINRGRVDKHTKLLAETGELG